VRASACVRACVRVCVCVCTCGSSVYIHVRMQVCTYASRVRS